MRCRSRQRAPRERKGSRSRKRPWAWAFAAILLRAVAGLETVQLQVQGWRDLRAAEDAGDSVCLITSFGQTSCMRAQRDMRFDAPISDETNEFHIRDADEANFRRIWWRPAAPSTASMKKSPSCRFERISPRFGATIRPEDAPVVLKFALYDCAPVAQKHASVSIRHMKRSASWVPIDAGLSCEKVSGDCSGLVTLHQILPGTHSFQIRAGSFSPIPLFMIETIPSSIARLGIGGEIEFEEGAHEALEKFETTNVTGKSMMQIVLVGTLNWDGQKVIWSSLLRALQQKASVSSTFVSFTDRGHKHGQHHGPFLNILEEVGAWFDHVPLELNVPREDIPLTNLLRVLVDSIKNLTARLQCTGQSCRTQCSALLHRQCTLYLPAFGVDLIHRMVGAFEGADILFFANSKEFTDVLLVETARLAGIGRIIMDLPNTDPHPEISPDIVVAPSRATLREISVKRLAGAKMVIYPGADLDRFAIAQNVRLPPRCVIGFVARLEPEKSAGLFIDMVTKLHTTACDFVIVGDGSMFSSLRMLARKLGVQHKIHFTGMLHGDALPFMMARMYVIVNPSTSETETFCIVNIEAMALGIPLVSFGAGGVSDYLEHGVNGILVDEVSGHGLARGVQLALKMRDVLSIGARKTARKFSLASMTAKYLSFVE